MQKDNKFKKLADENKKLLEDVKLFSTNKIVQNFGSDVKSNEINELKNQIKILEERLRKQRQVAEKPYDELIGLKSRSKV